eukprot:TRINITY_DN48658_c0_g1_i1.p1 TRINITY_DN48658_c0_g1~~TRINITY_DN48658_c0_g1_i1.p1  ORF type:complete len:285 (-),score=41.59 TRINITY_DN48658_c0_g1_i1:268-1122(-)
MCLGMSPALRVACLGDSWVSDWAGEADSWRLESPLPWALKQQLEKLTGRAVELIVAGLPGFTAKRMSELAKLCRLRDIAEMQASNGWQLPCEGDLQEALMSRGAREDSRHRWGGVLPEDVDIVVIIAGYNDLRYDSDSGEDVAQHVLGLRQLYAERRHVDALVLTIGEGRPEVESRRQCANLVLRKAGAIDCDPFVASLPAEAWGNSEHLIAEGYATLGVKVADAIAMRSCVLRLNSSHPLRLEETYVVQSTSKPCHVLQREKRCQSHTRILARKRRRQGSAFA